MGKMKLAIVVGHNAHAQGAFSEALGQTEFTYNSDLAELIRDHDESAIRIFFRERGGGYSREIDRVYGQVNRWGATASIELHFNSVGNPNANGGLTLTSGTNGSMRLARLVQVGSVDALGVVDRGLCKKARGDRGGRSLWVGKAPAILTEPFFGSNANDANKARHSMDKLADAIYRAAVEFHK